MGTFSTGRERHKATRRYAAALFVTNVLNGTVAAKGGTVFRGTVLRLVVQIPRFGLAVAPGGDILTVNSGDGNLVETTPSGFQVAVRQLDSSGSPPGAGALFGLAVKPFHRAVYFVDDATNTLNLLH